MTPGDRIPPPQCGQTCESVSRVKEQSLQLAAVIEHVTCAFTAVRGICEVVEIDQESSINSTGITATDGCSENSDTVV